MGIPRLNPQLMLIPKPGMDITTVVIPDITEDTEDTTDTVDTTDTADTEDTTDTPTDHMHTATTENAPLMLNPKLPPKPPLKLMLMPLPIIMVDTMDTPDTTDMDTDTDTVWDTDHTMVDTADTTDTDMVWDTVDTTGARRRMSGTIPSQFV